MPSTSILGPFKDIANGVVASTTASGRAFTTSKVLPFEMQNQQQSNWCWAAVASSVCSYYAARGSGSAESQCRIATQFLGIDCCITPLPPASADWAGNREFTLELPLSVLGHCAQPIVTGPLDMTTIAHEIDEGRPICCHIDWGASVGHFVAIIGYDATLNEVIVRDPIGTIVNGTLPFKSGSTFAGGKWSETYLTN